MPRYFERYGCDMEKHFLFGKKKFESTKKYEINIMSFTLS